MKKLLIATLFAVTLASQSTFAQAENTNTTQSVPLKIAKSEDIVGAWRVIAFMPGSFGVQYPDSSLLAPAQIYGFFEDGAVRSLNADEKKTFTQSLEDLKKQFSGRENQIHWQNLGDGLVAITIDEKQEVGTLWLTTIVEEDGMFNKIQVQKGDMVQAMTPSTESKSNNARYIRILRQNTNE